MLTYKPIIDHEEDLREAGREEGREQGIETTFIAAIKGGASSELLQTIAKAAGLSLERAEVLYKEVKQNSNSVPSK